MASSDEKIGVVLLNMGGPDSLDAIEPFLFNLFNDNDIIPLPARGFLLQWPLAKLISSRRAKFVRSYYEQIGGRSPIARITRLQAKLLEDRLNARAPGRFRCYVAMRYWRPFTDEAIEAMRKDGVSRIVALTLYPHYTTATTESSLRELKRRLAQSGELSSVPVLPIDRFPDEPHYLDAMARRVRLGLHKWPEAERRGVLLLFSAHGLPVSFIKKGDPYVDHLHRSIAGIVARLAMTEGFVPEWLLTFQSRAGPTRWLEPATDETLRRLAAEAKVTGRRDVLCVPISFVSDHIETLYEINRLFGDEAKQLGLNFRRATALNGEPLFTEALAALVERRLAAEGGTHLLAARSAAA